MKVLELMHSLEEAYDRFGDIEVSIAWSFGDISRDRTHVYSRIPKELIIESEEFIIKCE